MYKREAYGAALLADDAARTCFHQLREEFPFGAVIDAMREACPELSDLPAETLLLERASSALAETFFGALENPPAGSPLHLAAPLASGMLARDLARWGLPVEIMLQAYHVGNVVSWRWLRQRFSELVEDPDLRAALLEFAEDQSADFALLVMRSTVEEYAAAKEAATRGRVADQLTVVRRIIESSEKQNEETLSRRLGYDLSLYHVGFVIWSTCADEAIDFSQFERNARSWMAKMQVAHPLVIPVDGRTLWAWGCWSSRSSFPTGAPVPPDVGLRAAVGQVGRGMAGFRETHREAAAAVALAHTLKLSDAVLRHTDLETMLLLDPDQQHLESYVQRKLGRLAADDPVAAELRDTLRVFLESGERVNVAAANGHLHRNSVRRRLEQAIELRGESLDHDRLGLALALEIEANLRRARQRSST